METIKLKAKITIEFEYDGLTIDDNEFPLIDELESLEKKLAFKDPLMFLECRYDDYKSLKVEIEEVKP